MMINIKYKMKQIQNTKLQNSIVILHCPSQAHNSTE